jgi:peptidoglycan hydrolase CwlO-like protein
MAEMKITLLTSVICLVLGFGVIIGAAIALPYINGALNNLQNTASTLLTKADNSLSSAQNAINSTQVTLLYLSDATNASLPALSTSGRLTNAIATNLTSIGSTVSSVGQTLSGISIVGTTPLASVGNTISSIGQPISSAGDQLQQVSNSITSVQQRTADAPNRIHSITIQLDNVKNSLNDLKVSVNETQNMLPTYFNQIWLIAILAMVGLMGLGVFLILIGLSLYSLRRKSLELNRSLYRLIAKYPI